jgi:hypothetical protein
MTGCFLLVDPATSMVTLPATVSSFGQARPKLPLPSTVRADFRAQLAWLAANANSAGVLTGRGFLVRVH